jgi:cyclic pyranopterin phosphate synthase
MVEESSKPPTARRAVAEDEVAVSAETLTHVIYGGASKGDVNTVGELAGGMGGKRTAVLIRLCNPIALTDIVVSFKSDRAASVVRLRAEAA